MKEHNEELRGLVDHLSRVLKEENAQRCPGTSQAPASPEPLAARRLETSVRDVNAQSRGAWQWQDWEIHPMSAAG